ncbi:MAG: hypothetical protein OXG35_21325 [Acidobacteria bacterium]|nr:hypothetical protein [Acidobacteriota bacterium]
MNTDNETVLTDNVGTIAGFTLAILLAIGGATWNLRGLIASEITDATAATSERLDTAVAEIHQEIRTGREASDRQTAEIRQLVFETRP